MSRDLITLNFLYSCNIGEGGIALAEAVHGSAPDIAGKVRTLIGVDCSAHMLPKFSNDDYPI